MYFYDSDNRTAMTIPNNTEKTAIRQYSKDCLWKKRS